VIAASSGIAATALRPRCLCCGWAAAPVAWPLAWPRLAVPGGGLLAGAGAPGRARRWPALRSGAGRGGRGEPSGAGAGAAGRAAPGPWLLPRGTGPGGVCPWQARPGGRVGEVLVPDRGVAPGLGRLLREMELTLRSGGNSLQPPADWLKGIHGSVLALVVADREADTWASLRRGPLGPCAAGRWPHGPTVRRGWRCRPTGRSTGCCATPPRSWGGWAGCNSWRAGSMRPVHQSKPRGTKCFWCAAAWLPPAAD
jgi:hypothetical protein